MINSLVHGAAAGAFVIALAILAGCSTLLEPQPDLSEFFVLTATAPIAPPPASAAGDLSIGLGPVRLPSYLSGHQEIATRVAPNQVEYSATGRWAEPLDSNFSRVLERDISDSLGNVQIVVYPWFRSTPIDYKIEIDVERFELTRNGDSELSAHWRIRDGKSDKVLVAQQSSVHHAAQGKGTEASVAALSADVGDLCDQIVTALRGLEEDRSRHARTSNGNYYSSDLLPLRTGAQMLAIFPDTGSEPSICSIPAHRPGTIQAGCFDSLIA